MIPASRDDTALNGLPVIRESSDPTRDVETAARLVDSRNVADRVIKDLGLDQSADSLLAQVTAEPVAQSNIVAITRDGRLARPRARHRQRVRRRRRGRALRSS